MSDWIAPALIAAVLLSPMWAKDLLRLLETLERRREDKDERLTAREAVSRKMAVHPEEVDDQTWIDEYVDGEPDR